MTLGYFYSFQIFMIRILNGLISGWLLQGQRRNTPMKCPDNISLSSAPRLTFSNCFYTPQGTELIFVNILSFPRKTKVNDYISLSKNISSFAIPKFRLTPGRHFRCCYQNRWGEKERKKNIRFPKWFSDLIGWKSFLSLLDYTEHWWMERGSQISKNNFRFGW